VKPTLRRRWTLRARLTVVFGLLFFLAGAVVLGVTYLLVRQTLDTQTPSTGIDKEALLAKQSGGDVAAALATATEEQRQLEAKYRKYQDSVLASLLQKGSLALAGAGVIAVGGAWVLSGRMLRPIGTITETARRVAERNLHERIALGGPRDEVRELADTFDEMLERLDRSFDGQRRFVGNASHELKTPIAINRTMIEVALDRPDAPAQLRALGENLLAVNARHERLIDGLLTLARSEQALATRAEVDLAAIAAHVLDETDHGTVTVERDLAPVPVIGDAVLLERLVQNLVSNGVRYNVDGGRLRVRTEARDGLATLTVANSGPVIAPYEVPGLFEPFQRLTNRVGSAKGTGLGLSIVRSVARVHGGDVMAEAAAGGGLVVRVTLPHGKD
jgi:signal transduction histidine kinase